MGGKQAKPGSPDMTLELSGSQPRVAPAPRGPLAVPEYIFWVLHQGGASATGIYQYVARPCLMWRLQALVGRATSRGS